MTSRVNRATQDLAVAAAARFRAGTEVGASAACVRRIGTLICVLQRSSQGLFRIAQQVRTCTNGGWLLRTAADACQHGAGGDLTGVCQEPAPGDCDSFHIT